MKRFRTYALILLLAGLSGACTERIDLALDPNYARLVVDGTISTDTGAFAINLTQTADYFSNVPVPRVTGATVTLSYGDVTDTLHETEPGMSGLYETGNGFHGVVGQTYTLNIKLKEEIAKESEYTASSELPGIAVLDSAAVQYQPDWGDSGFYEIKAWFQEPLDQVNWYMFNLYRNGQLITDSLSKVFVTDDRFYNGQYINGATVMYIDNSDPYMRLREGDVVTLMVSGITKEYYDFISQVQLSGISIPFFTGPPANVVSNVNHGAVGFFAAYSNTRASTIVTSDNSVLTSIFVIKSTHNHVEKNIPFRSVPAAPFPLIPRLRHDPAEDMGREAFVWER